MLEASSTVRRGQAVMPEALVTDDQHGHDGGVPAAGKARLEGEGSRRQRPSGVADPLDHPRRAVWEGTIIHAFHLPGLRRVEAHDGAFRFVPLG
jgi:hypothetical protein